MEPRQREGNPESEGAGRLPGKIVAVFSAKGGVGKTTLVVNLAVTMGSCLGERVVIWDLNLELGNACAFFGVKPQASVADLLDVRSQSGGWAVFWESIRSVLCQPGHYPVDILSAPPSPERAEATAKALGEDLAGHLATHLRSNYPITLLDTPSNFAPVTLAALDRADLILMVTSPDLPALYNTAKGLDFLFDRLADARAKVRLVLNRADAGLGITQDDIAQVLNFPISFAIPSDGVRAVTAANTGQPFMCRRVRGYLPGAIGQLADGLLDGLLGIPAEEMTDHKVLWVF